MKKKRLHIDTPSAGRTPKYIINPEWNEAAECYEQFLQTPYLTHKDIESTFPEKYGKKLEEGGNWIRVQDPPHCQYTVPPFSIWFAMPWPMEAKEPSRRTKRRKGEDYTHPLPKRVKILTPMGDLGIFPHEYSIEKDVSQWLGREKEGVFLHMMNGQPAVDQNHLHYIMSRGIPKPKALLMLIGQIKDPTFLWFEIAPQYGEYFGRDWPGPERCPFCTPKDQFKSVNIAA